MPAVQGSEELDPQVLGGDEYIVPADEKDSASITFSGGSQEVFPVRAL
eukprot:CAMPEP_0167785654 /NCGR_PEP_ID=MMETSP0111_2-20121227/8347_1 /TAXON_ID=91324 /ORGANISM="Lotharella globosa, Strain CCCM811" /LENGTH=47 /DNA_ID= /DNA_START= /DNA_END= /DNA_ORIENTATION=